MAHLRLESSPALETFAAPAGQLFVLKKLPLWVREGAALCFIYNGASPDPPPRFPTTFTASQRSGNLPRHHGRAIFRPTEQAFIKATVKVRRHAAPPHHTPIPLCSSAARRHSKSAPNRSLLVPAAEKGNLAAVENCLSEGTHVNVTDEVSGYKERDRESTMWRPKEPRGGLEEPIDRLQRDLT